MKAIDADLEEYFSAMDNSPCPVPMERDAVSRAAQTAVRNHLLQHDWCATKAIARFREKLAASMKSKVAGLLGENRDGITAQAMALVESEILALCDLNQLA